VRDRGPHGDRYLAASATRCLAYGVRDDGWRESFDIRRQELFATLATALVELSPVAAHSAWRAALATVATRERTAVLDAVGALAPLVARLGGTTALDEAEAGIGDAARWWP